MSTPLLCIPSCIMFFSCKWPRKDCKEVSKMQECRVFSYLVCADVCVCMGCLHGRKEGNRRKERSM